MWPGKPYHGILLANETVQFTTGTCHQVFFRKPAQECRVYGGTVVMALYIVPDDTAVLYTLVCSFRYSSWHDFITSHANEGSKTKMHASRLTPGFAVTIYEAQQYRVTDTDVPDTRTYRH